MANVFARLRIPSYVQIEEIDPKSGRVLRAFARENTVTENLRASIAANLANALSGAPSHIGVGTGVSTSYEPSNQDDSITLGAAAVTHIAQGIVVQSAPIKTVLLWMKSVGAPAGSLTLHLYGKDGSNDPLTLKATSTSVPAAIVGTSYGWVSFNFPTPVLDATIYFWVLTTTGYTYSAGVTELTLGADGSASSYAPTTVSKYAKTSTNGTSWTTGTKTAIFRVIPQSQNTATALLGEQDRNLITSRSLRSTYTARFLTIFTQAEANEYLGQIGLFDSASGGKLLAIANIDYLKTSSVIINAYWNIPISGA